MTGSCFLVLLCIWIQQCSSTCPCQDHSLCATPQLNYTGEVMAMSSYHYGLPEPVHWTQYHWDKITTFVAHSYPEDELGKVMCYAHAHGTRVVIMTSYPIEQLLNDTFRDNWVQELTNNVSRNYIDGVNIDFEDAIYSNQTKLVEGYTKTIQELYYKLKRTNENYQLSIDSSWAPFCNDSTMCYNYKALSEVTDFIFTMSYDEQSQIFGPCVASANAGMVKTSKGIKEFLSWGIPPRKLVLGVPWYGYNYKCVRFFQDNNTCAIAHKQLRTSNCSDIVGQEISYSVIVGGLLQNSTSGRLWSSKEQSPFLNYIEKSENAMYQVWYDDVESLRIKYMYADSLQLRGVGMWAAESLDYRRPQDIQLMWGALPDYKRDSLPSYQ